MSQAGSGLALKQVRFGEDTTKGRRRFQFLGTANASADAIELLDLVQ